MRKLLEKLSIDCEESDALRHLVIKVIECLSEYKCKIIKLRHGLPPYNRICTWKSITDECNAGKEVEDYFFLTQHRIQNLYRTGMRSIRLEMYRGHVDLEFRSSVEDLRCFVRRSLKADKE